MTISRGGAAERARELGGWGEHWGLTDGDGQHSAGSISIGQEINKYDRRTTDDRAPGSRRAKLGREITTEWS